MLGFCIVNLAFDKLKAGVASYFLQDLLRGKAKDGTQGVGYFLGFTGIFDLRRKGADIVTLDANGQFVPVAVIDNPALGCHRHFIKPVIEGFLL